MPRRTWFRALGLVLLVGLVGVGAYALLRRAASTHSEKPSEDWSRGIVWGQTAIDDAVAFGRDVANGDLVAVWVAPDSSGNGQCLRLSLADATGHPQTSGDLAFATAYPTHVEVLHGGARGIHLLWIDRYGTQRALLYARLTREGSVAAEARAVTPVGVQVDSYAARLGPGGVVDVLWAAGDAGEGGIYHARLSAGGDLQEESLALGITGSDLSLRVDRDGLGHLAWVNSLEPGLHTVQYTAFHFTDRATGRVSEFASAPTLLRLRAPTVGLAGDDVYVFWALERHIGDQGEPQADAYYVAFGLDDPLPAANTPRAVVVPPHSSPLYTPARSAYALGSLAAVPVGATASRIIYLASTPRIHADELAVAFAVQLEGRSEGNTQIVLTIWRNGELQGYEIAGRTAGASLRPVLLSDSAGDLHVTWIATERRSAASGADTYSVYYASTSPATRAALDQVAPSDVLERLLGALRRLAQALAFLPIVSNWVGP